MNSFVDAKKKANPDAAVANDKTTASETVSKKKKKRKSSDKQVSIQSYFTSAAAARKKRKLVLAGHTPLTPPTPAVSSQIVETVATPPSLHDVSNTTTPPTEQAAEISSQSVAVSQESNPIVRPTKKDQQNLCQMYLDFGQKNFGKQMLCKTCGMLYVHGLDEDSNQHAKICQDYVDGVPFHVPKARVVAKYDNGSVIEIRPSDSYTLRQKVKRVRTIVDSDLGYNAADCEKQRTTYLFVGNKRVLGMATAETVSKAFVLETSLERSTKEQKAMVGIHQLWVHAKHRKQGIATRLLDAVRSRFVFGLVVPADMVAFSSPTEAGSRFARDYVSSNSDDGVNALVLVYDCK